MYVQFFITPGPYLQDKQGIKPFFFFFPLNIMTLQGSGVNRKQTNKPKQNKQTNKQINKPKTEKEKPYRIPTRNQCRIFCLST